MKRKYLTADEVAKIINETPHTLPPHKQRARNIIKKMAEQALTIQRLETLTAGLRDTCKLANEANRELLAANKNLLAQLNAIRADASAGPFLVVTTWKEAATFDEARRKAERPETLAETPARFALVVRPVSISKAIATTITDPAQVADFFAE